MGVSDHWVRVLLKRRSEHGDAVVVHGLRGLPSNRRLAAETQRQALAILKQREWHDFEPTSCQCRGVGLARPTFLAPVRKARGGEGAHLNAPAQSI